MLQGQAEIERNLKNVLKIVATSKAEALEEIGQRGVAIIKKNTPVGDTGRLKGSMGYSTKKGVVGGDDTLNATNDPNSVFLGTNVVYAPHVEYLAKNGSQGYMQRSFNQIIPIAKAVFNQVFKGGIK